MVTKEAIELRIKLVDAEIDHVLKYWENIIPDFNYQAAMSKANELRVELKTLKWVLDNGN